MKGIRKITPSQPPISPRSKFKVPPAVAAAASGSSTNPEQQPVKLKLQQAFLEQYSGAGQTVGHSANSLLCVCECAYHDQSFSLLVYAPVHKLEHCWVLSTAILLADVIVQHGCVSKVCAQPQV